MPPKKTKPLIIDQAPQPVPEATKQELFLSKSAIESFKQCSQKYKWHYIDKLPEVQSLQERQSAVFGQVIHSTLEDYWLSKQVSDLKTLYRGHFTKAELVDQDLFELGENMVIEYARTNDNGNEVLGIEQEFKIYLENGVPIKGVIDRIDKISDEEIEIIDYKTGRSMPLTQEQLRTDLQLGMYNLAAKVLYPQYKKVKLTLSYLHYGKISTYRTDEELETLLHYTASMYEKITALYDGKVPTTTNLTPLCHYCGFKSKCAAFLNTVGTSNDAKDMEDRLAMIVNTREGMVIDIDVLDQFREAVNGRLSILKKVKDGIDDIIKEEAKKAGTRSVQVGKTTFSVANTKVTTYDSNQVVDIFLKKGIDLNKVVSPNKTDIDTLLKEDKPTLKLIQDGAKISWTNSFLRKDK